MFTGIIEHVGHILSAEPGDGRVTFVVHVGPLTEGVEPGDSIAVNGACLTVTQLEGSQLTFDAVRETLDRTSLGELGPDTPVNLERAMRAGGRLDGHIVQGHVDGTGTLASLEREGDDVRFFVDCGREFADLLVDKGSVAIEGVSLTVCDPTETGFHVVLIPHTLEATTLGAIPVGRRLNLEADVLGKYVKRYLDRVVPQPAAS